MKKKIKCKVCGNKFVPTAEMLYLCSEHGVLLCHRKYECMDCPVCGHQIVLGIRENKIEEKEVKQHEDFKARRKA